VVTRMERMNGLTSFSIPERRCGCGVKFKLGHTWSIQSVLSVLCCQFCAVSLKKYKMLIKSVIKVFNCN
jgi:hypothetical protein